MKVKDEKSVTQKDSEEGESICITTEILGVYLFNKPFYEYMILVPVKTKAPFF